MSSDPVDYGTPHPTSREEPAEDSFSGSGHHLWRDWIRPLGLVLVVVVSFRSTVVDWNHVPSDSMEPTILAGDRIVVNKLAYDLRIPLTRIRLARWETPRRGDVVVFLSPMDRRRLVKRVVGLPGDEVAVEGNRLSINGREARYEPLDSNTLPRSELSPAEVQGLARERLEPGLDHPMRIGDGEEEEAFFGPVTVPAEGYFVLGDNRGHSFDSRNFGLVRSELVLGKATAIALSVDPEEFYRPRWARFFTRLP